MPFIAAAPEWNVAGIEPPQSLKDGGWIPEQKPPADYFNWYMYNCYRAILELQQKAAEAANVIANDQKGIAGGVATLGADGKVPASQLNVSGDASEITIADAANYYTGANVEAALQEIGEVLGGTRTSLVTSANSLLTS